MNQKTLINYKRKIHKWDNTKKKKTCIQTIKFLPFATQLIADKRRQTSKAEVTETKLEPIDKHNKMITEA